MATLKTVRRVKGKLQPRGKTLNLPLGTINALCAKFRDPGFHRACVPWAQNHGITRADGFCADLHKECTGIWPGEHKYKKKK